MYDEQLDAVALKEIHHALLELISEMYYKRSHFKKMTEQHFIRESLKEHLHACVMDKDPVHRLLETTHRIVSAKKTIDDRVVQDWERAETSLNCRLKIVFAYLGAERTANLLKVFLPIRQDMSSLYLHSCRELTDKLCKKRSDGKYGQPDVLLFNENAKSLVTIEMKVRGSKARAKYDINQHAKYLILHNDLRNYLGENATSVHILLAPFSSNDIYRTPHQWMIEDSDHLRSIDPLKFGKQLKVDSPHRYEALVGIGKISEIIEKIPFIPIDLERFIQEAKSVSNEKNYTYQLDQISQYGLPSR